MLEDLPSEDPARARLPRLSCSNGLLALLLAGLLAAAFLHRDHPQAARALDFHVDDAIGRLQFWRFVTYPLVPPLHEPADRWALPLVVLSLYGLLVLGNDLEREIGARRFLVLFLSASAYGAAAHAVLQTFLLDWEAVVLGGPVAPAAALTALAALRRPDRPMLFFYVIPMRLWTAVFYSAVPPLVYATFCHRPSLAPAAAAAGVAAAIHFLEPRLDRALDLADERRDRRRFLEEVEVRRRTDLILDKIAREGMDSLTRPERRTLKLASAILRRGRKAPRG